MKKSRENVSAYKDNAAEFYLDLNEVWLTQSNEFGICLHLLHIPGLHQGQSVHCPLSLDGQKGWRLGDRVEELHHLNMWY